MSRTLYVRHSGQTLDMSAIEGLFTTVGDVEKTSIEAGPGSVVAALIGVFEMSTEQQASDCVDRFHCYVMNGQPLSVRREPPSIRIKPPPKMKAKRAP
ncbi:MAG: hypothetical protein HC902_04165 [Calothrix sp. SM1_5_4]|nr:hypothetical protein [Calothrix sp. SM1_5_4]